jgi:hypothetical protein
MRTLTEKYLGGLELKEDIYKIDLAVLDRYQSFSSELLRLSLLGLAGYGFLISNTIMTGRRTSNVLTAPVFSTIVGGLGCGVCAAIAKAKAENRIVK